MKEKYWIYMLHLGYNFWGGKREIPQEFGDGAGGGATDYLRCNKETWNEVTQFMADRGLNMLLIDVGEGVKYRSHPELAVKGSWEAEDLKKELARLKSLGITPIPKLNFSTCHDIWLGEYERMVSTAKYYEVCKDLIEEIVDIFDKPQMFHLGMDEETYENQKDYPYCVVRGEDLWWHDFYKNVETLEKHNVRPWIWSDYIWHHEETFLKKMPKTVVQSNWYYDTHYDWKHDCMDRMWCKPYEVLEAHGYDQIPTGSNWLKSENFNQTVKYCKQTISDEHILGFLQTPWKPTTPEYEYLHKAGICEVERAKKQYY